MHQRGENTKTPDSREHSGGLTQLRSQDDWYEGYLIPKGATVIPNVWGMNHDPDVYPDPDVFRPERFLDSTGTADVSPPDTHGLGHVSYGFGKRWVWPLFSLWNPNHAERPDPRIHPQSVCGPEFCEPGNLHQ